MAYTVFECVLEHKGLCVNTSGYNVNACSLNPWAWASDVCDMQYIHGYFHSGFIPQILRVSPCENFNFSIQGGPEGMQQLWLLISWTSSMKQNCFLIYLVEHSFSNKMTPWSLVLGKVSGL